MLHSFQEGLSLALYSQAHKVDLCQDLHLHRKSGVRLTLAPDMCVIWHESIYHSGAKSRNTPNAQQDDRFFAYIWPFVQNNTRNRTSGNSDGVARESGDRVFRDNINEETCEHLFQNQEGYPHCINSEYEIDLSPIPNSSYKPGDWIIGNLDDYGWVVVRTKRVTGELTLAINNVCNSGRGEGGLWNALDTNEKIE